MNVNNQTLPVQTSTETKRGISTTQKAENRTDFSEILNTSMQTTTSLNISSLEIKMTAFSEAQIAQAISLEEYLEQIKPAAAHTVYTGQTGYGITMNTTQNVSALSQSDLFSTNQYDDIIIAESQKNGIDPLIIKSIIKHESGFNTNAVSSAGALGLMQLMPSNIRHFGVSNPFHAKENIAAGVALFKQCYDMYNGDLTLALAAYNAGPGNVKKYGGVPPFQETQNYIERVMGTYKKASLT